MPPIVLSAPELADRLDVSYESILNWARKGSIPSIRDGRNRLIFNLDAVLNALRNTGSADADGGNS